MPGAASAGFAEVPEFGVAFEADGSARMETVPPLGGVKFTVVERELPPILEFSVRVDSSLSVSLSTPHPSCMRICGCVCVRER